MSYRDRPRDYSPPRGRYEERPRNYSPPRRGRYDRSPSPRRGGGRPHPYDDRRRDYRDDRRDYQGGRRDPRDFPFRHRKRSPPPPMTEEQRAASKTLFVGNLPYSFREREASEIFQKFGRIKVIVVGMNRRTGQSKGHCFVEFEEKSAAEEAFQEMNGKSIEGRSLRIDWDMGLNNKLGDKPRDGGERRSPSPQRRRSPSPERRRSQSPNGSPQRRRSPSPERRRSPSPGVRALSP